MRKSRACLLFLMVLASSSIALGAEFAPGEVLVKYKEGIRRGRAQVNSLYDSMGVRDVRRLSNGPVEFEQLILDQEDQVQDVLARLRTNDSVEYAQPNYILHILPVSSQPQESAQELDEECAPLGSMSFFPAASFWV